MTSSPTELPTLDEASDIGRSLRSVTASLLRQRAGIRSRWWVSDARYIEVSVDDDDDGRLLVEVGIRGRLARWRRDGGVTTSTTDEVSLTTPAPASRLESLDHERRRDVLTVTAALLNAAPDPALRELVALFQPR